MANIAVARIKREFKEVIKSEEVQKVKFGLRVVCLPQDLNRISLGVAYTFVFV